MRATVVIRCRNEEAHIARLLTGISRQRRRADEVILVDSGSTDATTSIASQFDVEILNVDEEEFSFGRACNRGCAAATGDVVVFISAHCYPIYDSWLENLIAPLESEEVALSYGRQQVPPGGRYSEGRLLARWYPTRSVHRQPHPFCNNANSAVRRGLWEEIPFDENLTGLEDLDWSKRALDQGFALSYVSEAPVIHVHDESFSEVINRFRREAIAHKQIYHQRMSALEAARLTLTNVASDYAAAAREGALSGRTVIDIPRFRTAQFYGSYRGFGQRGPVSGLLKHRFYYPDRGSATAHPTPATASSAGNPIDYDAPVESAEIAEVGR